MESAEALWLKVLRCDLAYDDYRVKAIFLQVLRGSIRPSMLLYLNLKENATVMTLTVP